MATVFWRNSLGSEVVKPFYIKMTVTQQPTQQNLQKGRHLCSGKKTNLSKFFYSHVWDSAGND